MKNNHCYYFNRKGRHMFWGLLFGLLLILWGISHITDTLFHIHVPIFGIIFGLFLLYLGIQMITGCAHWPKSCCWHHPKTQDCYDTCFGSSKILVDDITLSKLHSPVEYKTIMAESHINMTQLSPEAIRALGAQLIIRLDTSFGKTTLKLNKHIPVRIIAKGTFAKVMTPDDNIVSFGSHIYTSNVQEEPLMIIYSSTSFGETKITTE